MRTSIPYSMLHCGACLVVMGAVSILLHEPLLIPAVGASVCMVLTAPDLEASSPKSVLVSHGLGASIGWIMLGLFHLHGAAGGLAVEMTWTRVSAMAVSLATTNAVLRTIGCSHPPAGASTMIVSIGGLPAAHHILNFELAAMITVGYGLLAHRLSGVEYPFWRARETA